MTRLPAILAATGFVLVASVLAAANPPLIEAVKKGDLAGAKTLLAKRDVDVNAPGFDGSTPLHWAAELDDVATARLLIQAGATVKATNRYGVAPLMLACTNGNAAMIELLLKAGADANTESSEGETVLLTAARTGNVEAVNTLLANGADPHKSESVRGQNALMWAAAEGHADVVSRLLQAGADLRKRSKGGFTALAFAVREGRARVVEVLLKAGADANEKLPPQVLRQTGATEYSPAQGGSSVLDVAVSNAHFEVAAMLLEAGADPNAGGPGWTPLHSITWIRKPGAGSNDPAPPGSGNMSSLQFVERLVKKGADVNARMTKKAKAGLHSLNSIGATPFLMAARTADAELMRLLVKLGADPRLTNADNSTPLMVAAGLGTRSPGEDAGTQTEVLEAVKLAIELGNDINAVDANGETALHGAAYKHLPLVAQFLAGQGVKAELWNQKNKLGWTPLRIAEGVRRTGNFRSSADTAEVIRKAMRAAGVTPAVESAVVSGPRD